MLFCLGVSVKANRELLKNDTPHIVVGTPGRILALVKDKDLMLDNIKHFVMDECDKLLESIDMRRDIQQIFRSTPHTKQVMMFSATLSKEIRPICREFCQDVRFNLYLLSVIILSVYLVAVGNLCR